MTTTTKQTVGKPEVYSYTRWSSKPQSRGDSERRQLEAAQRWCQQRGLTLSATEIDDGVSAKAGRNRHGESGLAKLLARVQPGDYLLVEDNDRLSREDWLTASNFIRDITGRGVTVVTLQNNNEITHEKFLRDPGCFLPSVLRSFTGNDENVKKSVRVKAAWATKREEIRQGKAIRQRLPGWLYHEKTFVGGKVILGAVKVDEAKSATIREIFKLTLAGWSRRRIAQHLNANKVPTVSGQSDRWNGESILACIIRNPAVIGQYQTKDGEVVQGLLPAVVDEKTYYAANAASTAHKKLTTPRAASTGNIATGLTRCPTCGGEMSLRSHYKTDGKTYRYLTCSQTKAGQTATPCGCRPKYDAFESCLLSLLADSATMKRLMGQQADGQPDELLALRGKVEAADRKLNDLMAALESAPSKALAARLQVLEVEGEAIREELMQKEAEAKAKTPPAVEYEQFRAELAAHLTEPEYRERVKTAIRGFVDSIQFIDKTTFVARFKSGMQHEVWMSAGGFDIGRTKVIGDKPMVP